MTTAIIVTKGRPDLLRQCLVSLSASLNGSQPPKVVVWDNEGDAETKAICREFVVKRFGGGANESFSAANNLAAQGTKGDLLLLNNDVFLQPGCISAMQRARREGANIVGAKLLYPQGVVQHYGIGFSRDYMPFHIGRGEAPDSPWCSQDRVVAATTFAAVLIERALWDSLGGLDEEYIYSYEDIDYCLRAREVGAVVGVACDAVAIHLESQTVGRSDNDVRNWGIFAKKWLDTGRLYAALGVWPQWIRR